MQRILLVAVVAASTVAMHAILAARGQTPEGWPVTLVTCGALAGFVGGVWVGQRRDVRQGLSPGQMARVQRRMRTG